MFFRVVGMIGRLLVTFGVLVLLFAAYLLWGTNLSEASHQDSLRQRFDRALAEGTRSTKSTTPTPTTTTIPDSLVRKLAAGDQPSEGQPIAIIDIPKISVQKVVVQGTGTDDLHLGPGHYSGTPLPGQPGNSAIAGHRTTYGAPFYNLNELGPGDEIDIVTLQGHFVYRVDRSFTVAPTDLSVLDPSETAQLTLTTCNPRFSAAQRLIVQASLTDSPAPAPAAAPPAQTKKTLRKTAANLGGAQGAWAGAAAWGAGALAFAVGALLYGTRLRRRTRWLVYAGASLPMLVLLFFFFENVSPLLPASY